MLVTTNTMIASLPLVMILVRLSYGTPEMPVIQFITSLQIRHHCTQFNFHPSTEMFSVLEDKKK
jgi:hypothetical protein